MLILTAAESKLLAGHISWTVLRALSYLHSAFIPNVISQSFHPPFSLVLLQMTQLWTKSHWDYAIQSQLQTRKCRSKEISNLSKIFQEVTGRMNPPAYCGHTSGDIEGLDLWDLANRNSKKYSESTRQLQWKKSSCSFWSGNSEQKCHTELCAQYMFVTEKPEFNVWA